MKSKFRSHLFTSFIALAFGPGLIATSAFAQSTWIGNTDANLATAVNWDTAPASGVPWIFNAAGSSGTALVNDLTTSTAFEVSGITFGAAASAYVIDSAHTGTFSLTGNIATTSANDHTIGSNIAISGARQVNLNGTKNITLSGNLSGNGTLTQTAGGTGAKSLTFSGDNSGFTGSFVQNNDGNNRTAFGTAASGSASAAWTFNRNINGGVALSMTNTTIDFGSLAGGGYVRANGTGTLTVRVGALGTSTTFSGILQQSNAGTILSLKKTGAGTQTLSGANTYAGATIVDQGTLDVTGTITGSAVTVNNSGTTFQVTGSGKTLGGLVVNGGTAKVGAVSTLTNGLSATGPNATLDLVNGAIGTVAVNGAAGLTLGGATASDTPTLKFEVGGTADKLQVANGLVVDAGGASIQITNLGLAAGQSYPLITFTSGSGAGYATGTGTTVGALTLANPGLSFGVSGTLEVTATGVNLVTSGAAAPDNAYWSGANGSNWSATSGSNANFTTTAGGGTFLNVLPASNSMVYFSNNSPSNLTNTLGANFDIFGLTYRATSAAVSTSGTDTLTLEGGGITVESGNGGATLAMNSLILGANQTWQNDSANPLAVSAASVTGPSANLTLAGTGGINLGGGSFSVNTLQLNSGSSLDVKGTPVTASLADGSSGNITNTAAVAAVANLTFNNVLDATYSGVISDSGTSAAQIQLVKSGAGVLTLSNANTHTGGTSISAGTLKAGNNNSFSAGTVTLTGGTAVLDLNGATISNPLANSGTGAVITNSSATEAVVTSGFNYADAGSVVISDFTVNGTGDIRWDGAIRRTAGFGTMTKSGSNTLTINEDNDASAPLGGMNLRVDNGTVFLGQTSTSFQDLTINGGTLKMDPTYEVATASIWAGVIANTAVMNGGVWDLNDTGTGTNVTNRIKRISGTGGIITNSGTGASQLILAARDTAAPVWAGNIQDGTNGGTVALTITNGGSINQVMNFSGAHTYSGDTNIIRNVMQAGAANVFSPNSAFILSNNTESKLDLNGFNNTIGSLTGINAASQVLLGSATLTTGAKDDASTTFAGVISGTGGIIKAGAGTFTLTGANTYTGNTTVNAGAVSLADNAGLKFVIGVNGVNNKVTGAGTATIEGDFTFDLSGADATPGNSWTIVDTVGKSFTTTFTVNGFSDPEEDGTWTYTDESSTTWTFSESSGALSVGGGATAYETWAQSYGLTGANADPAFDYDNDGLDNLLEFVLGGNPTASQPGISPSVTASGSNLVITFKRSDQSETDGVGVKVQTSTTLAGWTDDTSIGAADGSGPNGITYTVAESADPDTLDTIVVTIPKGADVKKFTRVTATVTP